MKTNLHKYSDKIISDLQAWHDFSGLKPISGEIEILSQYKEFLDIEFVGVYSFSGTYLFSLRYLYKVNRDGECYISKVFFKPAIPQAHFALTHFTLEEEIVFNRTSNKKDLLESLMRGIKNAVLNYTHNETEAEDLIKAGETLKAHIEQAKKWIQEI